MLEFMADLFKEQGHEVVAAEDGLTALEALENYVPDIAFIDLVMPNIRGDRLCRIIRTLPHLKNLFMVIISATTLEELTHFAELGANAAIAKGPLDQMARQLIDVLDKKEETLADNPEVAPTPSQVIYQRKITKELLYAERHLETILNNISQGVFELNPQGKIIFCNNRGFSLSGTSEATLLGRNFVELFNERDRREIEGLFLKIGDGPPQISDGISVEMNEQSVSLRFLPIEDHTGWSVIAIVTPLPDVPKPQ